VTLFLGNLGDPDAPGEISVFDAVVVGNVMDLAGLDPITFKVFVTF
jgi:hypothetical protein